MGHSQSYDLRNPENGEKVPVKGVRRVSKEHQADLPFSTENTDPVNIREEELRERIRREQLKTREEELNTLRIKQHEQRESIIDAYRPSQNSPQAVHYKEFNHYDSLKHRSPADPNKYQVLKRRAEVNEGLRLTSPNATPRYDQVPIDPSPQASIRQVREVPVGHSEYPRRSSVFNGRVSPLPLQEEVDPHPMPRYIPPMSPRYERIPEGTHYQKTTTTTTYNIYRSASVPRFDDPPPPPSPKLSKTYSRASKLSKYEESSRSPRPVSMYSKFPENPRYDAVPPSPKPSSTYSKASKIHNIPVRYSKGTEYSESHYNPSGYITYSRASKLPKYDEVPRSTLYSGSSNSSKYEEIPRSPSLHSLRVPTYDEVPYQKSPRSVTPIYIPPNEKPSSRVRIIPVQTSPPVPKPPIHLTPLQQEISPTPLNHSIRPRTHHIPIETESRSESPAIVIIPFSASSSVTSSPRETPIYRTLVKPPRPSKTLEEIPSQDGSRQRSRSMDKITITSIYRTPSVVKKPQNDAVPSPRKVEKLHVTKRENEVPWVPLSQCIVRRIYDTPPSEEEDDDVSDIVIIPFSKQPSPPRSVKSKTPPLQRQDDVPRTPLIRSPLYSRPPSPITRTIIVPSSTRPPQTPPRTPSPKIHLTRLEKEVPRVPLERYVNRKRVNSSPPSPTIPKKQIPIEKRSPSVIYLTRLHPEVPRVPLDDYVAQPRSPVYSNTPSPTPTVISIPRTPSPPVPPPKIYLTRLQPEVPKCPLDDHVAKPIRGSPTYSNRSSPIPRAGGTPPPPTTVHRTRRVSDIRKTPLGHYVNSEPLQKNDSPSPVRKSSEMYETPLEQHLRSTPIEHYVRKEPIHRHPSSDNPQFVPSSPRIQQTPFEQDLRKTPLNHYVNRESSRPESIRSVDTKSKRTPPPYIYMHPSYHSIRENDVRETPLGHYVRTDPIYSIPPSERTVSNRSTPIPMPYSSPHQTRLENEIRKTPMDNYVRRSPYYSSPPLEDEPTGYRSVVSSSRSSPRMPPKMHLTRRHSEVPYYPITRFVRSPTPSAVKNNSLSKEKPYSSLDHYPKNYTRLPEKDPVTPPQKVVSRTPISSQRPRDSSSRTTRPPSSTSSIGYHPLNKSTQTPSATYRSRPSRSRSATVISIYSTPIEDVPPHVSELHAEKRMIVGIDDMEKPENITYVTVATSPIHDSAEPLHRHPEVGRHPVYVIPSQSSYETKPQYTRRSSEDLNKVIPPRKCEVEHCTHVEVTDDTPIVARRRISQESNKDKENRLTIFVDENDMENVVEIAHENEGDRKRCFEETLHYDSYMPTLSLARRPIVSFYDKLH
uniref:CCDC50_N domain-containing protein n=1 Tax=Caenorhabditis tropicalis TaxID=1561998 RepID=A0A1I7UCC4_9PELO